MVGAGAPVGGRRALVEDVRLGALAAADRLAEDVALAPALEDGLFETWEVGLGGERTERGHGTRDCRFPPWARWTSWTCRCKLSREEEAERLEAAQRRLLALRLRLGGLIGDGLGPPLCVLLEGWDASGKGGAIRRLVAPLDPRHVRVKQFAAPTPDEKRHHWQRRFWPALPGWGGMAVLDRSWYGRVLVERVEHFASDEAWQRAYEEIRDFEHSLVAEGMVLVKLWLHISDEEQLEALQGAREGPAQELEADRRGLAQPREAAAVR